MKLTPSQNAPECRLVLIAPAQALIPDSLARVETGPRHHELLTSAQRLRGKVYLQDGAIRSSEVSPDGRHCHPADECAWHLLLLDRNGEVRGCSRYVAHPNNIAFSQLGVRNAALARSIEWASRLRTAVDSEVAQARLRQIAYVEVGGWALEPAMRHTAEAIRIALATYSLARLLGGCIGITTATTRHCSSAILRKIGGRRLRVQELETSEVEIQPYYDPQYE